MKTEGDDNGQRMEQLGAVVLRRSVKYLLVAQSLDGLSFLVCVLIECLEQTAITAFSLNIISKVAVVFRPDRDFILFYLLSSKTYQAKQQPDWSKVALSKQSAWPWQCTRSASSVDTDMTWPVLFLYHVNCSFGNRSAPIGTNHRDSP